ncbi:hypothetical protein HOY82DRAFT_635610 [Tuber indicum]|nr:hypothetical protein HOY82DRAFT_635610 [Tuber indicum]
MSGKHEKLQPSSEAALRSQVLFPLAIPSSSTGLVPEEVEESQAKINLHPTSLMRDYVHQKLSILPSLFKDYGPGVQHVRALITQDFEPQERPTVMRAFWDAFHGLDSEEKTSVSDVWADWREQRQEALLRKMASQNFNVSEVEPLADHDLLTTEYGRKPTFNLPPSSSTTGRGGGGCTEETTGIRASSSRQNMRAKLVDIHPKMSKGHLNPVATTLETVGATCITAPPLGGSRHRPVFKRNSISGEFPEKSFCSTPYLPSSEPLSGTAGGRATDSEEPETPKSYTSSGFSHTRRKSFDWFKMSDESMKSYNSAEASVCPNLAPNSDFEDEITKTQSYQSNVSSVASDSGGGPMRDCELRVPNFKEYNSRLEPPSSHFGDLLLPIKAISKGQGEATSSRPVQSFVASPATNSLMSVLERLERQDIQPTGKQMPASGIGVLPPNSCPVKRNILQDLSRKSDSTINLNDCDGGHFAGMGDELPAGSKGTQNMEGAFHSGFNEGRVTESSESPAQDHPTKIKKRSKFIPGQNIKTSTKILAPQTDGSEYSRSRFSLTSLPRSLPVVDKFLPSESSVKVSHLGPTPEENEGENISNTSAAKPAMRPGVQTNKTPTRWVKTGFTRAIGGMIQEGVERTMPHLGRKPVLKEIPKTLPQLMTPPLKVNKHEISSPFPTENPLQVSSSSSSPNIIQFAIPIKHIPRSNSTPLKKLLDSEKHENRGKQTELLPWDFQNSDNSDNGSLSDEVPRPGRGNLTQKTPTAKEKNLPAVTITPMDQASLYAWVECTVVKACSDFLRAQLWNLDVSFLGKEVKKWEDEKIRLSTGETKHRDRVIEFMFGMEVQCRLVERNMKVLYFSGPAALNPAKIISSWKAIIPSFSPRTFCVPDYLILEHFRVLEKVLGLFGPVYYDAEKFESKRLELVRRIMRSGDDERQLLSVKRLATLREEREKAEEELLKEVGLLTIKEEE